MYLFSVLRASRLAFILYLLYKILEEILRKRRKTSLKVLHGIKAYFWNLICFSYYGMAATGQSSLFKVTSQPRIASPVSIPRGGTKSISHQIIGHKLNGHNYLQWSSSVIMFICGKSRDDYLTRDIIILEKNDPNFQTWKTKITW